MSQIFSCSCSSSSTVVKVVVVVVVVVSMVNVRGVGLYIDWLQSKVSCLCMGGPRKSEPIASMHS